MNPDQDQHRRNRLLAALRPRDYALLEPHLQIVPIGEGEFLHLPGNEIEQAYFLHRGIVSLMTISEDGDAIATASVGSEGAIGTIAGTGFVRAFTRAEQAEDDTISFSQERLADMLGLRRSSVTLAAQTLQSRRFVSYRRGRIDIINRKGLQAAACECYEVVSRTLDQFLEDKQVTR